MGLPEGNQAIRTPSPIQGVTGDPGELTPELGLASYSSAQSDCQGCWSNHHPENWTGGGKRRLYPWVRGNGGASMTPASSSRQLPVTQHTGKNWLKAETLESREGVRCCPARRSTDVCQRGAVRQRIGGGNTPVKGALTPRGHGLPWDWYAKAIAYTFQWAILCLETALPFCWPPWQTKSSLSSGCGPRICAMILQDTATPRLDLLPPRAMLAGSPPDRGCAWWEP